MKEQLVEMTNLSPRVIRVWFQVSSSRRIYVLVLKYVFIFIVILVVKVLMFFFVFFQNKRCKDKKVKIVRNISTSSLTGTRFLRELN